MVRVTGFDHLVLIVSDVEQSLEWYRGFLGLDGVRVEEWRAGQAPFPSVRVDATTIIDFVPRPTAQGDDADRPPGGTPDGVGRNLDHICLVVEAEDLSGLGTPVGRFGARGEGTSVYLQDPDGYTVELRHYGERAEGGSAGQHSDGTGAAATGH